MSRTHANSSPPEGQSVVGNDQLLRRQRLAQMIGHLLARTWWQRWRDQPALSTTDVEQTANSRLVKTSKSDC